MPFVEGFDQVTDQDDKLFKFCSTPRSIKEIMEFLEVKHRTYLRKTVLAPLLESGKLVLTIPEKPSSPNQRYVVVK